MLYQLVGSRFSVAGVTGDLLFFFVFFVTFLVNNVLKLIGIGQTYPIPY